MTDERLFQRGTTLVRRLRLAPGEAMHWHRDPFHRVSVVLQGDALTIPTPCLSRATASSRVRRVRSSVTLLEDVTQPDAKRFDLLAEAV